jgi:hypothetical protein
MSAEAICEYEAMIQYRLNLLIERLHEQAPRGPVDLTRWLSWWSFDFMGDMAFGGGSEFLRAGDDGGMMETIGSFNVCVSWSAWYVREILTHCLVCSACSITSSLPWATQILNKMPMVGGPLQKLRKFGVEQASKRLKNGTIQKDLFYHLVRLDLNLGGKVLITERVSTERRGRLREAETQHGRGRC